MEGEVTVVLHNTMKLNNMEEIMDTTILVLHRIMDMMLLIRAVDVVAVEGEVVEEDEAVVDSTDRMDHRTMQLLK